MVITLRHGVWGFGSVAHCLNSQLPLFYLLRGNDGIKLSSLSLVQKGLARFHVVASQQHAPPRPISAL